MPTITAESIINKVHDVLQDAEGIQWTDQELLGWLNDGQRDIVVLKPNAYVKNDKLKLSEGSKQTIPADGIQLIEIVRNLGTNGLTPGRVITIIDRRMLDSINPDWHTTTSSATVDHFMFTPLDPKRFYVYPPQPSANQGYVEIVYGAYPVDATLNGVISIDDIYQNALIDYILYRAFSKDSEFAADANRANAHQAAYFASITGKSQAESTASPNNRSS